MVLMLLGNSIKTGNPRLLHPPGWGAAIEKNDEWAIQRRYMSLETLATLGENGDVRLPATAN